MAIRELEDGKNSIFILRFLMPGTYEEIWLEGTPGELLGKAPLKGLHATDQVIILMLKERVESEEDEMKIGPFCTMECVGRNRHPENKGECVQLTCERFRCQEEARKNGNEEVQSAMEEGTVLETVRCSAHV